MEERIPPETKTLMVARAVKMAAKLEEAADD